MEFDILSCPNEACRQRLRVPTARGVVRLRCPLCRHEWVHDPAPKAVPDCFVALDFETANPNRSSACALGLVRVEQLRIVAKTVHLIRPPTPHFTFTHIHGIAWATVRFSPTFHELWPKLQPLLQGAQFVAAHNAYFDRSVLLACCQRAGLPAPNLPFLCTVQLARRVWGLSPTNLPSVCQALSIPLQHHDAGSDAEACARIVLEAIRYGWKPHPAQSGSPTHLTILTVSPPG